MTDVWNGIRSVIVIFFILVLVAGSVYGVSQIIPQYESVKTSEARINAENALLIAQAEAAPTFTFLSVEGTRVAIDNGRTLALAQANAQTIQAQGQADYSRGLIDTFKSLILTGASILGVGVAIFFLLRLGQAYIFTRPTQLAIREAKETGGSVELPNGHRVLFQKEKSSPLLGEGTQKESSARKESRVKRR